MYVKICGIKRVEDALKAVECGADAIGVIIGETHQGKDFIDENLAAKIVEELPFFCSSVMVTTLVQKDEIIRLAKQIGVSKIQLHGPSTPEDIYAIKQALPYIKIVKTIHVADSSAIEIGKKYLPSADAILLDTHNPQKNRTGGTGMTHDWEISKAIVSSCIKPVILAGGLNPGNIRKAVSMVSPFGVDVNTGVKGADGFKDYQKLESFILRAKGIE